MRSKRIVILVIAELVIAVAFAFACALVLLYEKDEPWLLAMLVIGGIAGLLNGAYLLKLRRKPPARRRPGTPPRKPGRG